MTRTPVRTALLALALIFPGSAALAQRAPGWIGIAFDVQPAPTGGGSAAVVTEVSARSPADAAGVTVGDRLLAINDLRAAEGFENLAERLRLRVGDRVAISLERGGRRIELAMRAGERPSDFAMWTQAPPDSMAESMFRKMDSLRIQILKSGGALEPPWPGDPGAWFTGTPPGAPDPVSAPFEFFVFRGEQHDSLRLAMQQLNDRIAELRQRERRLDQRRSARGTGRSEAAAIDRQLAVVRETIEQVMLESSELRAAMAEAARTTAGFEYELLQPPNTPDAPDAQSTFRPLTPYLLGSNRVAGAEVVDLRPGLAEYFGVESGVLVVDVSPGTPASIAGIQPGDVIVNLDRVGVRSVDALRVGIGQAGDTLPVTLIRQGSRLEVLLRRR